MFGNNCCRFSIFYVLSAVRNWAQEQKNYCSTSPCCRDCPILSRWSTGDIVIENCVTHISHTRERELPSLSFSGSLFTLPHVAHLYLNGYEHLRDISVQTNDPKNHSLQFWCWMGACSWGIFSKGPWIPVYIDILNPQDLSYSAFSLNLCQYGSRFWPLSVGRT